MFNQTWKIPLDDSNKTNQRIVFMSKWVMWLSHHFICLKETIRLVRRSLETILLGVPY